jgi:integrase
MPAKKRFKTKYPGVYYTESIKGKSDKLKAEKTYYVVYRKDGRVIEEPVGKQYTNDMTPSRAAGVRARRIQGEKSNKERREAKRTVEKTKRDKWTIDKLWEEYIAQRAESKGLKVDKGRYEKFLKPVFGKKEPRKIIALDVDRMRVKLLKTKSPQTVKHVLNLLTWIVNYGVKNGLCPGLSFHMKKPEVHNEKTEDLTPGQLEKLLEAIEKDTHPLAGPIMKLALFTGMRRGEIFKLKWKDVDFDRGFIHIRDPKGGPDQVIPMNDMARELLESHSKTRSPYVFPGRHGKQRTDIRHAVNKIRDDADLPKDFRALHGLRHVYASILASSGEVDMYVLQKLLTHKSPVMTQRYAHLRDEALKRAANVAGDLMSRAMNGKDKQEKVVNIKD